MSGFKLVYFDGRGRAEVTRLIFHAAGAQFEDERVKDWPAGKEDSPLGQLPYLVIDGETKLPQSHAIARLIARKFNLAGKDDIEQAKVDAVVDTVSDIQNLYYSRVFHAEDKEAAMKKFKEEDAPLHLGKIEKLISLYGSNGYAVGDALTWADLLLYEVSTHIIALQIAALDTLPGIAASRAAVEANEKLGPYLKSRPELPF